LCACTNVSPKVLNIVAENLQELYLFRNSKWAKKNVWGMCGREKSKKAPEITETLFELAKCFKQIVINVMYVGLDYLHRNERRHLIQNLFGDRN